ncbi:MAG: hypothetical protein ACUVTL_06810 [Thermoproteota archaeon]
MSFIGKLRSGRRQVPELWLKISELCEACLSAAKSMEAAFISVASGDRQSAINQANGVAMAAKKGLILARESRLLSFETSPADRDHIIFIIEALRALLNSAQKGSIVLVQRRLSPSVVFLLNDIKLQYTLSRLFEKVTKGVSLLSEAITILPKDQAKSAELISSARKESDEVESIKLYLLEKLYEQEKALDVLSLIQLRDIILYESLLVNGFDDCLESLQTLATVR